MMARPPAPDDRQLGRCPPGHGHPGNGQHGNGQHGPADGAGRPGDDPPGAQRARLAAFWALVLRRFRGYAQGSSDAAAGQERDEEDR
jgi:hypothetical protein